MTNAVEMLRERGLISAVTNEAVYTAIQPPATVYAGFDPSSDSLQVGNLVTVMILRHFRKHGHKVVAVVGGGTGLVGDPSGKDAERDLIGSDQVGSNAAAISECLSGLLDCEGPDEPAKIVDNRTWLAGFSFVDFLREVGKHFRMGAMLGKDSVRARLASEGGMSFAEFSYQLLQGYDFLHLYDTEGCVLQVGGSDQWGNITAGIDLIRKRRGVETYGVTTPLLCDSSGRKLGKSEGGAIYLGSHRTSIYDFYQYFIRTADADVIQFLRVFTDMPAEELHGLEREIETDPESRAPQVRLADEVTRLVHGDRGLESARKASSVLFGASMEGLDSGQVSRIFADAPSSVLAREEVESAYVTEVAVSSGLCGSNGEARRLARNGGLYVNNRRVDAEDARIMKTDLLDGTLLVLRSGKRTFRLVRVSG